MLIKFVNGRPLIATLAKELPVRRGCRVCHKGTHDLCVHCAHEFGNAEYWAVSAGARERRALNMVEVR